MVDTRQSDFVRVGSLEELKTRGRLVLRGRHRPVLVVYDQGRVFALDNRCPHMGFPLHRGGPMFTADQFGVKTVYDAMSRLYDIHGQVLKPAPLLEKLAKAGKEFKDL